jgi:hypothetical protein
MRILLENMTFQAGVEALLLSNVKVEFELTTPTGGKLFTVKLEQQGKMVEAAEADEKAALIAAYAKLLDEESVAVAPVAEPVEEPAEEVVEESAEEPLEETED